MTGSRVWPSIDTRSPGSTDATTDASAEGPGPEATGTVLEMQAAVEPANRATTDRWAMCCFGTLRLGEDRGAIKELGLSDLCERAQCVENADRGRGRRGTSAD